MIRTLIAGLFFMLLLQAGAPVYVVLWFDTEDYIEPSSDDAALRIAADLSAAGVQGTFKVVGEKARVLESRGRLDVIAALKRHDIGYHSNWHSLHPTPSEYLNRLGFVEGAAEFERREGSGVADVRRVFGVQPVCYGQPGNSWGPQSMPALRRLGIPVYLDDGDQVGLDDRPFWYGGLLHVFNMGTAQMRAQLNVGEEDKDAYKQFDDTVRRLTAAGGGLISIYYHPTEFVTTEFWDAANFQHGANPPRAAWVKPHKRTPEDSERCYGVLRRYVAHMKQQADVRFVTAHQLLEIYGAAPAARAIDHKAAAGQLAREIVFADVAGQMLSPADMLLALLNLPAAVVDGPATPGTSTLSGSTIPAAAFDRARADVVDFIQRNQRLPNEVFIGAETLSLADFTATLAGNVLDGATPVKVGRGRIGFERYFATDARKSFDWIIHPETFKGEHLLELARLQGWTLKPARPAVH